MAERKYYEAYEDRYSQIHEMGMRWSNDVPSHIILDVIERYHIDLHSSILELGCGEGRDAHVLLENGYDLLATDISSEAISWCREEYPEFRDRFTVLDALHGELNEKYGFIYAIALLHMLVEDEDRQALYRFIGDHLNDNGIALIGTMGNGEVSMATDPNKAFEIQTRDFNDRTVNVAATTCRMVTMDEFVKEIDTAGLTPIETGITEIPPEFDCIMYAVIRK